MKQYSSRLHVINSMYNFVRALFNHTSTKTKKPIIRSSLVLVSTRLLYSVTATASETNTRNAFFIHVLRTCVLRTRVLRTCVHVGIVGTCRSLSLFSSSLYKYTGRQ